MARKDPIAHLGRHLKPTDRLIAEVIALGPRGLDRLAAMVADRERWQADEAGVANALSVRTSRRCCWRPDSTATANSTLRHRSRVVACAIRGLPRGSSASWSTLRTVASMRLCRTVIPGWCQQSRT